MERNFDIIILGATGFTGQYVVEHLAKSTTGSDVKWAVAGRDPAKLNKVLQQASANTGLRMDRIQVMVCDVKDELSLTDMTKQGRILLNCVGPYRFSGKQVVKACLATQTHHLDISGEPQFLEGMQLRYHQQAIDKGVYIIGSCGFDSIPSDVGGAEVHRAMGGPVNHIETYIRVANEGKAKGPMVNFGTWQSLIHGMAHAGELKGLRRQLFPEKLPWLTPRIKSRGILHKSPVVKDWCLIFPGADRSVMLRTERARFHEDNARPAQVQAYIQCPNYLMAIFIAVGLMLLAFMSRFQFGRYLLETFPGLFSLGAVTKAGPSKEVIENTNFEMTLIGRGWRDQPETGLDIKEPVNREVKVVVKGRNIGYGATCECFVQAGLAILKEKNKLPATGGVWTPGYAFRNTSLAAKLHQNGVTFDTKSMDLEM